MNNVLKILKKKESLFLIIYIFLAVVGNALNVLISNGDELWNFFNIYKMNNGFLIYNDLNVIITPLFFYLGKIFLSFANNILAFRLYNCFLLIIFFLSIYKLLRRLEFSRIISFIIMNIYIFYDKYLLVRCGANYNILAIAIGLIGICFLIKNVKNENKNNSYIQGFIGIIIFLTKQNIGVFYTLGFIIYTFIKDKNMKEKIHDILKYLACFSLIFVIFLIYLFFRGNLLGFIDYCFLGISEFATNNFSIDAIYFSILLVLTILSLVFIKLIQKFEKNIEKNKKENIKILTSFALPFILIGYPIFNKIHCILSLILLLILFLYLIFKVILKDEIKIKKLGNNDKTYIKIFFITIISIFMIINSAKNVLVWQSYVFSDEAYIKSDEALFGGIVKKDLYENINNVVNFIKNNEKEVIVFSPKSALYMTEFNTNYECFDLPFKGNFGSKGEKGIIEKIESLRSVDILIEKNEEDLIWQESIYLRNYIINNLEYVGEIENFKIYEKKV